MRVLIVCLLASAVLSASLNLTPRTRLSSSFNDLVFNNQPKGEEFLGGVPLKGADHIVSPSYKAFEGELMVAGIKKSVKFISQASLELIKSDILTVKESSFNVHYIFSASVVPSNFNFAVITLDKTKRGIKYVISQKSMMATGISKKQYFHFVKHSELGFPFKSTEILIDQRASKGDMKFHQYNFDNLLSSILSVRGTQMEETTPLVGLGQTPAPTVFDAINAVASAWKSVASAFKNVNRKTLTGIIRGQGFSTYRSKSNLIRNLNIDTNQWAAYVENLLLLTDMDLYPQIEKQARKFLDMAVFLEDSVWHFNNANFDKSRDGITASAVMMSKADLVNSKAHILTVVTDGTFKLAPDVYIYEKFKSVAGGIYQSTKELRENVPRGITEEDVKGLVALAMLNAINVMTKYFKIPFSLPEDPLSLAN